MEDDFQKIVIHAKKNVKYCPGLFLNQMSTIFLFYLNQDYISSLILCKKLKKERKNAKGSSELQKFAIKTTGKQLHNFVFG